MVYFGRRAGVCSPFLSGITTWDVVKAMVAWSELGVLISADPLMPPVLIAALSTMTEAVGTIAAACGTAAHPASHC